MEKNKVVLEKTQKELLKTMKKLSNLSSKERFKTSLDGLSGELDRIEKLFSDTRKIVPNDKSIIDNLSNFDKFLNDVPDINLDFQGNFNDKLPKVKPLLNINLDSLNKLDSEINSLGKYINFEKRNEKLNTNPLSEINPSEIDKTFKTRGEKLNVNPIYKINPDKIDATFISRGEKLNVNPIYKINPDKMDATFIPREEKLNITPINKIDGLVPNEETNFTPRKELLKLDKIVNLDTPVINTNFDKEDMQKKMDFNNNFFDNNKELIEERLSKMETEINFIENFTKGLNNRIEKIRFEFNNTKILEGLTSLKIINDNNIKEKIDLDMEDNLESFIPKIYKKDSILQLNKKNYYLDYLDFNEDTFIQDFLTDQQKIPILIGGSLEKFIELSKKYESILAKRKIIIDDFKEKIGEYNVLFIQYFNYKFFLMKNMQKFYMNKRPIYQYITYNSFQKYLKVLNHLNKIIDNPKKIFETTIPLIVNNTHTIMYFKHFLIIKILYIFFNEINKTDVLKQDSSIDIFESDDKLGVYFIIFNLYYKVLDKYNEIFSYSE